MSGRSPIHRPSIAVAMQRWLIRECPFKAWLLRWTIVEGRHHWLSWLLANGVDPDLTCPGDRTPLRIAVSLADTQAMQYLLQAGAAADVRRYPERKSLLLEAAMHTGEEGVSLLLEAGVPPDAMSYGVTSLAAFTVLAWAAFHGHEDLVRRLLQSGADPARIVGHPDQDAIGYPGAWNAATLAAESGHTTLADLLETGSTHNGAAPVSTPVRARRPKRHYLPAPAPITQRTPRHEIRHPVVQ